MWNQVLKFDVTMPDIAVIYFKVVDCDKYSSNDTVAVFAMPFNSLRQGQGRKTFSFCLNDRDHSRHNIGVADVW